MSSPPYCCIASLISRIPFSSAVVMASAAEVWSQILSWLSLVLTVVLLLPQAYLNYQSQSTQGLSTAMMWIFLVASIVPAAYYIYQSEPVALTIAWFGFAVVGIFVLCQVPYYAPSSADKAAVGSDKQRLTARRRLFAYNFAVYTLVSSLCCVFFYFLFVVSGPSSAFSWLPSAVGYIFPSALTAVGYLLQFRLIVATKDASGISPGFIVLDLSACICTVLSIALHQWDGAAAAPLFVIIACQLALGTVRLCVYPPNKAYNKELQGEQAETAGEGDGNANEDDEEEEEEEDDGAEGEEVEMAEVEETAEQRLESGVGEQSETGHVPLDTSLDSTDEDEGEHDRDSDLPL